MDTYRKMLIKVYDAAAGRESVDVDFVEIAKREGYFPSIDDIVTYLKSESWVTESRTNVLRLTHWGIAQVRKDTSGDTSDNAAQRSAEKIRELAQSLSVLSESLAKSPTAALVADIEKKNAEIASVAAELRKQV